MIRTISQWQMGRLTSICAPRQHSPFHTLMYGGTDVLQLCDQLRSGSEVVRNDEEQTRRWQRASRPGSRVAFRQCVHLPTKHLHLFCSGRMVRLLRSFQAFSRTAPRTTPSCACSPHPRPAATPCGSLVMSSMTAAHHPCNASLSPSPPPAPSPSSNPPVKPEITPS